MLALITSGLDAALERAGLPYGYTITIWEAGTIAAALGAVALIGRIDSGVVWLLGGFVATSVYLAGMAAAIVLQGGTA